MAEFPHKPCGQYVEFREVRKGIFGKSKIEIVKKLYNVLSGKGGKKGEPHNCPEKYDRPWECEGVDCHQMIYLSSTETFDNGNHKVINDRDGPGGLKGERHICPNRLFSRFHKWKKPKYDPYRFCSYCGTEWFENVFTNCPGCSCIECRDCGHQTLPKLGTSFPKAKITMIDRELNIKDYETGLYSIEKYKDPAVEWPCPKCGSWKTKDWARWRKPENVK